MNDLQLLIQLAMQWMTMKGGNVQEALDKAEQVLEAAVEREFKHAKNHTTEPQTDRCYYCRMTAMARQRRPAGGVINA